MASETESGTEHGWIAPEVVSGGAVLQKLLGNLSSPLCSSIPFPSLSRGRVIVGTTAMGNGNVVVLVRDGSSVHVNCYGSPACCKEFRPLNRDQECKFELDPDSVVVAMSCIDDTVCILTKSARVGGPEGAGSVLVFQWRIEHFERIDMFVVSPLTVMVVHNKAKQSFWCVEQHPKDRTACLKELDQRRGRGKRPIPKVICNFSDHACVLDGPPVFTLSPSTQGKMNMNIMAPSRLRTTNAPGIMTIEILDVHTETPKLKHSVGFIPLPSDLTKRSSPTETRRIFVGHNTIVLALCHPRGLVPEAITAMYATVRAAGGIKFFFIDIDVQAPFVWSPPEDSFRNLAEQCTGQATLCLSSHRLNVTKKWKACSRVFESSVKSRRKPRKRSCPGGGGGGGGGGAPAQAPAQAQARTRKRGIRSSGAVHMSAAKVAKRAIEAAEAHLKPDSESEDKGASDATSDSDGDPEDASDPEDTLFSGGTSDDDDGRQTAETLVS